MIKIPLTFISFKQHKDKIHGTLVVSMDREKVSLEKADRLLVGKEYTVSPPTLLVATKGDMPSQTMLHDDMKPTFTGPLSCGKITVSKSLIRASLKLDIDEYDPEDFQYFIKKTGYLMLPTRFEQQVLSGPATYLYGQLCKATGSTTN